MIYNLNQYANCDFVKTFCNDSDYSFISRYGKIYFINATIAIEFGANKASTQVFGCLYNLSLQKKIDFNKFLGKSEKLPNIRQIYKDFIEAYTIEMADLKHYEYEKGLAFYLFVISETLKFNLDEALIQVKAFYTDTNPQELKVINGLINEQTAPIYQVLRIEESEQIMGVEYPQINGIEATNEWVISNLRNPSEDIKIDELNLDLLLMKVGAKDTCFYSSYYLKSRGIFVGKRLKDSISVYSKGTSNVFPLTVNEKYAEKREIYFIELLANPDIIDFEHSVFEKKFASKPTVEIKFLNYVSYQSEVQAAYVQQKDFRIIPKQIYLQQYPDLFIFPLSNTILISRSCTRMLQNQQHIGYKLQRTPFVIQ